MADIVFFDLEFTAWEGSLDRNWSGDNEYREVVQIGAVRCDGITFKEKSSPFMRYVKPQRNPVLSDFFTDLTGITNNDIQKHGVLFEKAAQDFHNYIADSHLVSFGNDALIMNENRVFYDLEDKIAAFEGLNLRPWFQEQGFDIKANFRGERVCSGNLAAYIGADDLTVPHDAVGDALSVRKAVSFLVHEKNHPSPFLSHDQ